ncbi:MAG TPA: hypothetical protein VE270_06775 [Thermoleophilaceae bacterium]|nr:hypothetical protein [Thermoleophilaceae bacterium]
MATLALGAGHTSDSSGGSGQDPGGTVTPPPDYVLEKRIPAGVDVFDLNLRETRRYSASKRLKVLGHSYLKGDWLTPIARREGLGAGLNGVRVHEGIAYLAGYDTPPTMFGVLIADVRNPRRIRPLSFIPCNPGARCAYLRLNAERKILVVGHDQSASNPRQPPAGQPVRAGFGFYDVSDPRRPRQLGFLQTAANGKTHGFDIDGRHVYGCAWAPPLKPIETGNANQELKIIDYADPRHPREVGNIHVPGQRVGEEVPPQDQVNPDGSLQQVSCHEVVLHDERAYVAWRDAGMVIVDVEDPSQPRFVSRLDYVPPFHGGALGAAHTSAPVVTGSGRPRLLVQTDEIFDCPPGFGRLIDISDLDYPRILSSFRIPAISDNFDFDSGRFRCEDGFQTVHLPWFDFRSPSLVYVTWYDQGLRVWNISNPFLPRQIGYYISPRYAPPQRAFPPTAPPAVEGEWRQTREVYQDRTTGRLYVTDGNGGGLTVVKWTGPVPDRPPIPGAR